MQECGRKTFYKSKMRMKVDQFNPPPGELHYIYDLIKAFEISLYFSTVLLKYFTVIIGLFTVLVMIVRCYMDSIVLQPNHLICAMFERLPRMCGRIIQINSEHSFKIMSVAIMI